MATATPTGPEIDVQGGSPPVSIVNGDITPSPADHTDFGGIKAAGTNIVYRTFSILNTGDAPLVLDPVSPVTVSSPGGDFSLSSGPASPVAAGGSATFTVAFDPITRMTVTATVTILSNDADESPYFFLIQGEGLNTSPTATNMNQSLTFSRCDVEVSLKDIVVTDPDWWTGPPIGIGISTEKGIAAMTENMAPGEIIRILTERTETTALLQKHVPFKTENGAAEEIILAAFVLDDPAAGMLTTSGHGEIYDPGAGVWFFAGPLSMVNQALAAVAFVPDPVNPVSTTISTYVWDPLAVPLEGAISLYLDITPSLTRIPDQTVPEDFRTEWLHFSVNAPCGAGNPSDFYVSGFSDNETLVPKGNIAFERLTPPPVFKNADAGASADFFTGFPDVEWQVRVLPAENQSGQAEITIYAASDEAMGKQIFLLTVAPVNDPPRFLTALPAVQVVQGQTYSFPKSLLNPLVEDPDTPDGDLIWSVTDNVHITPVITDDAVSFTAPSGWAGTETVTVVVSDGELSDSETLTVTVLPEADNTPPAAPVNLIATAGEDRIQLTWDANTEPDAAAYSVFRNTTGATPTQNDLIGAVVHPVHAFTDSTALAGITCYYWINCTDGSGNPGAFSNMAQAVIEPDDNTPPAAPVNLAAAAGEDRIQLTWDANTEPDAAAYSVFRNTTGATPTQNDLIGTVVHPVHAFTDSTALAGITCYYWINCTDGSGNPGAFSNMAQAVIEESGTAMNGPEQTPAHFGLAQNYPNPFNPATRIRYTLAAQTRVTLTVYDLLGHEVARLADGIRNAGTYSVTWNAGSLGNGIYYYRLETETFTQMRKCMLMK